MVQSDFATSVAELVDTYIAALDQRHFDEWLGLHAGDGYYAVLRRIEFNTGSNLLLVGEDMKRLRGRISSGETRDQRRTVHVVGWVRAEQPALTASAAFALWMDGIPAYAGTYEFQLTTAGAALRLQKCTVVLDNQLIKEPIYLPI